jgi:hypothetical protein
MRLPLQQVPLEIRRLAVEHLESIRNTPLSGGADLAQIAGDVCPMHRPDVDGVAYWEFELQLAPGAPKPLITSAARSAGTFADEASALPRDAALFTAGPESTGFIIVSTGEHDFPVPHWSLQKPAPSRELEAAARKAGKEVAVIYRLDALSYLAEDRAGQEVARSGQIPVPIEGLSRDATARGGGISSMTAKPQREVKDDKDASQNQHSVEYSGPKQPDIRLIDPREWAHLKSRYVDSFGPLLDHLRTRAQEPWRVHKLIRKFGEGIVEEESLTVALLDAQAAVSVSGEGADLIEVSEARGGRAVRLRARKDRRPKETDFNVHIRYGNGEEETLAYFIVSRDTPSTRRGQAPRPEEKR